MKAGWISLGINDEIIVRSADPLTVGINPMFDASSVKYIDFCQRISELGVRVVSYTTTSALLNSINLKYEKLGMKFHSYTLGDWNTMEHISISRVVNVTNISGFDLVNSLVTQLAQLNSAKVIRNTGATGRAGNMHSRDIISFLTNFKLGDMQVKFDQVKIDRLASINDEMRFPTISFRLDTRKVGAFQCACGKKWKYADPFVKHRASCPNTALVPISHIKVLDQDSLFKTLQEHNLINWAPIGFAPSINPSLAAIINTVSSFNKQMNGADIVNTAINNYNQVLSEDSNEQQSSIETDEADDKITGE